MLLEFLAIYIHLRVHMHLYFYNPIITYTYFIYMILACSVPTSPIEIRKHIIMYMDMYLKIPGCWYMYIYIYIYTKK